MPLEVKTDPRVKANQADLEKQFEFAMKIRDRITEIHQTVSQIRTARANLEARRNGANASLTQAIDRVEQEMAAIERQLIQSKSVNRAASLVYPIMLDAQYADLGNVVESAEFRSTVADVPDVSGLRAEKAGAVRTLESRARRALETRELNAGASR